ncbi:unnamed protein product [Phyllotreta striolata]|uniref:phospholipase A2 n=1 Tax=Phyllotreta striolata TaxID=444603 RepID=A0A9N9TRB9_PHYSR|nr:unnamed protein product [Phyllotreta striolata]
MRRVTGQRPRCTGRLLVAVLLALRSAAAAETSEIRDFVETNVLPDGEVETRVFYKGVVAKETRVGSGSNVGLRFRELTQADRLIQLIVDDDGRLIDCDFGRDDGRSASFLSSFRRDLGDLVAASNGTVESLDGKRLPGEFGWMDFGRLKADCKRRHREMKERMQERRSKRDVGDIFRVPGTKWCGKGYSADKYTRLGGFSKTDRCCRKHDLRCPFWIGGFETKYGLFNWRFNTLMHCNCDDRACLKRAGTGDANMVGKLFFNVVQTKCFVLKPKKSCVRHSWWGKCEKTKVVKQAVLRDNVPF